MCLCSSPFLSKMQPNAAKLRNMEQMLSKRNANQREVIRNKNHASDERNRQTGYITQGETRSWLNLFVTHHRNQSKWGLGGCVVQRRTWMQVLMSVKSSLEPPLSPEGSDRPQALKGRWQVGEHRTPSCRRKREKYLIVSTPSSLCEQGH